MMRTIGLGVGGLVAVALVGGGGVFLWAQGARDAVFAKTWDVAGKDVPVPFPLTAEEVDALRAERLAAMAAAAPPPGDAAADAAFVEGSGEGEGAPVEATPPDPLADVDLDAVALERAVARGKHLMFSRLGCPECHGDDLAGGTMIDAPPMGTILGPNITPGGVTKGWTAAQWDRIVRHGVMSDGRGTIMPAEDFHLLSDRELSDTIAYARSVAAVDKVVPAPTYGPVFTMLVAFGELELSAYKLDHGAVAPTFPPPEGPDATFGAHLAQGCQGCHRPGFNGGPIPSGDPAWPPASNLTPEGIGGWTFEDFERAVRQGVRKDGSPVAAPMPTRFYAKLSDVEIQAIWAFVQTLPATPTGT